MSDIPDWEKKYWDNRLKQKINQQQPTTAASQPHYEPLHVSQARMRGEDPNQSIRNLGFNVGGVSKLDDPRVQSSRELSGQLSASDNVPNAKVVMIREGARYYRQIQMEAFGVSIPLLRTMGQMANAQGRQFEVRGQSRGYIVDGLSVIDAGKMNESPERFISLVKIRAPFVGDIFVESSSLIEVGGNQQTILKG